MLKQCLCIVLCVFLLSCASEKSQEGTPHASSLTKNTPHPLDFEKVSIILQDMKTYADAVKKLDKTTVQTTDKAYDGVSFQIEQKPLFLNVYPDPAGGKIILLLVPKDPSSGANYLMTFDRRLPVIDAETVELQIRSRNPENPFTCTLNVTDATAYMSEYQTHTIIARYQLNKKFLQSGTYDFDALTVPSYRTRGYAFIVFDLAKVEIVDQTASVTGTCSEQ